MGWPIPVFQRKSATDEMYERLVRLLLDSDGLLKLAVASHNFRSHAYAEAVRESLSKPEGYIERQTLFRTAEGLSLALARMGWIDHDYVPVGELIPGMAYLVRRILENTSQVGLLMASRIGGDVTELLRPPSAEEDGAGSRRGEGVPLFSQQSRQAALRGA